MDRKKIDRPLKQLVEAIRKNINPQRIILYGSYARGDATAWSDIDIAIIASFSNMTIKKRLEVLDSVADSIKSNYMFDLRGYNQKEFKSISSVSIYSEIKKEGIVLYSKN